MKRMKKYGVLFLFLCAPLSCFAQREILSSINTGMDELETILLDIQNDNESLKEDTRSLRENLTESEDQNRRLLELSKVLREQSNAQGEEYKRLSALYAQSGRSLKRWRLACLIAIPTALAAGILSGLLID
jgi:hypothetical protein